MSITWSRTPAATWRAPAVPHPQPTTLPTMRRLGAVRVRIVPMVVSLCILVEDIKMCVQVTGEEADNHNLHPTCQGTWSEV